MCTDYVPYPVLSPVMQSPAALTPTSSNSHVPFRCTITRCIFSLSFPLPLPLPFTCSCIALFE